MRKYRVHQFFFRGLEIHRHYIALDQFGYFGANHVCAEQLAGLLVKDHLHQPLIFPHCDRLAVSDERKVADADVDLLFLCRLFGEPDRSYLRRAIGAARDHQLVHRMRAQALDRRDADDALMLGLVRQHRRTGDVADGIDARHIGPIELIDGNDAAISLDAEFFEPEIFDVADDAHCRDDALGGDGLRFAALFDSRGDTGALFLELRDFGIGQNLDALLLEALACQPGDLRVLDWQDLRQHFHHGDLGAERAVERGELDADGAGTDDQQRFRQAVGHHGLEISPDQFLVRLDAEQHARSRAGSYDDVLALIGARSEHALRRVALGRLDRHLAGCVDERLTPDHRNLVLFHEKAD